jgi:hypothetical protein
MEQFFWRLWVEMSERFHLIALTGGMKGIATLVDDTATFRAAGGFSMAGLI